MEQTLYCNKCRICGTEIVLPKKLETCAACGSDCIASSKCGVKHIDIAAIVKTVLLVLGAIGAAVALFCII